MAAVASAVPRALPATQPPKEASASIKTLAYEDGLTSIPSTYVFSLSDEQFDAAVADPEDLLPVIDFSLLTSSDPDERSKGLNNLARACHEWGFFMVINHGVPESQVKAILDACHALFNLTDMEKPLYEPRNASSPTEASSSFNRCDENVFCWRDCLNLHLHPKMHSPNKPDGFREVLSKYVKATREVALKLLGAVSESLGLEEGYIEKPSDQDTGFSLFTANLYPRCPQPDLAMGIAPHTNDGFPNLLIQNDVRSLQLMHNGKWVNVHAAPKCFHVNVGGHIEIVSNGKYKSVLHRATVNHNARRESVVVLVSPSSDEAIAPIPELVNESNPSTYRPTAPVPSGSQRSVETYKNS